MGAILTVLEQVKARAKTLLGQGELTLHVRRHKKECEEGIGQGVIRA